MTVTKKIDFLIFERYVYKTGNWRANRMITYLEEKLNITSNCDKGYFG